MYLYVNMRQSFSGFREKKFAIISVKVYAAGLYVNESILTGLTTWKGRSADEIQRDSSLFNSIFQGNDELYSFLFSHLYLSLSLCCSL